MKFIKKTLLPSKSSSKIQALCLQHQKTDNFNSTKIEEQLKNQYEQLKKSVKIIKNQHKYQAYLQSFQSFLDVKHNMINKKIQTFMTSLHLSTKKKQKQIPLIQAFSNFQKAEKYKFLIDLMKYASQLQNKKQQQKPQLNFGTPTKKRIHQFQQSKANVTSDASISLNELKTMSLSYWTKVNFELCLQKREIKVTGKQSFILYLQNYLIRLSKKQKHCFVLQCCNREQVPSWLRKVYIHLKAQIFIQVFQSIWTEIIHIQVQKMTASFQQVNNFVENSPAKSVEVLQDHQNQPVMEKEDYLVFLTPFTIKNYFNEKNKFLSKLNNKLKFHTFKQVQFNGLESDVMRQKLTKIQFLKAKDQKNKQIYQVKGHFTLPASVVKFKFIDALKQKNKFITSWEILQTESEASIQAISQTLDFGNGLQDLNEKIQQNVFKFKQLFLKEESVKFNNDQISEILTLQSIGQISKNSFLSFLLVQCQPKKQQKCNLIVTCQFNKNFIKRKLSKQVKQSLSKQQITSINNKVIQNFLKETILMIFNQEKMYQQKTINEDQQFFTICEAFNDEFQELETCSAKSSQNIDQFIDQNNDKMGMIDFDKDELLNFRSQSLLNFKKVNSLNENDAQVLNDLNNQNNGRLNLRKVVSLQEIQSQDDENFNINKERNFPVSQISSMYLKSKFLLEPLKKPKNPQLVKQGLLQQDWIRLQQGGLTCKNEQKIKQQKQILKKIIVKLGENLLKQKNIMHVSLPVTIFKPESQLVTVARGLTYAPLFLQPHCYSNRKNQIDDIERVKKAVIFLISNNYAQINFEKPFNPILGQTYQGWIDGCPVYFQQISHHPPVTYYNFLGRGYKIYGSIQPVLSLGINNAKVTSWTLDCIEFDDGTKINAGPNKMMVNGTTFGLRTFNLDEKNFVYDLNNNILAVFSYGPTKKGLFSTSSQPLDFLSGRIMRMTDKFKTQQYQKWRKNMDYSIKKQWVEGQIGSIQGIWSQKIQFDGTQYFDFSKNLPFQLVEQKHPLPSDCRYRQDLQWLIKKDLQKSQLHKQRMQQQQRRDKKLRTNNK